jgi:hypothetical protein
MTDMTSIALSARRLLAAAAIALAGLALLGGPAHASTRTTTWYTLNVAAPSSSSPGLFLTTGPNGTIALERYVSGAPHEQWTPVYPEWPGAPTVTGHGPLEGFSECFTHWGCPFHGHGGGVRKFVNRLNGQCLTFRAGPDKSTIARLNRCTGYAPRVTDQTFEWLFSDAEMTPTVPRYETAIAQMRNGRPTCLTVPSNSRGVRLSASRCTPEAGWRQEFRFLEVDQETCEIGVTTNICGLPSWWRA